MRPFVEQRGVGRIEVFGLAVVQNAAAEADDAPLLVADGKHDAVAETVVVSVLLFVMDDLPAFRQGVVGIGLEDLRQRLPAVGCVAQSVMADDFGIQAASVEVLAGRRVDLELVAVKIGAGLQGFFQRLLFFLAVRHGFPVLPCALFHAEPSCLRGRQGIGRHRGNSCPAVPSESLSHCRARRS